MTQTYKQINLISNNSLVYHSEHEDPNLVDAWGIVSEDDTTFIASNGPGYVIEYEKHGAKYINVQSGNPSGLTMNKSYGFAVTSGSKTARSKLIVVTENGIIAAYSPLVDEFNFITVVDDSVGINPSVFKGIAQLGDRIYVTDFHNAKVNSYDSSFNPILTNTFSDPSIPAGFAPFGITAIHDKLYVSYALQDGTKHDDVAGPGNGYINVFDGNGNLVTRLVSQGPLNSPWAMIRIDDRIVVGNFGDGAINTFTLEGHFIHDILNPNINGLWGLLLKDNKLYFTAGPNSENDGLYGYIDIYNESCDLTC